MKKIFLVTILLSQLTFLFGQNFRTADEMKNAIDLYIDLGYHINSCKERCDFDYCSRIFTTWYSQAPKDYYNQREDDITNAWEASKKSTFKSSTCDCGNFEKPNLSLSVKAQKSQEKIKIAGDLVQSGINTIYGIADAIKANSERKEQEAISKDLAQQQLFLDAENGIYNAQVEVAKKYFKDRKYELAEKLYTQAMHNPNANEYQRSNVVDELITTLILQQKNETIIELINSYKKNDRNTYETDRIITFLKINCNEYLTDYQTCDESVKLEGVKELIAMNKKPQDNAFYAYLQVLGNYEIYGLKKDETKGLKTLFEITERKYDTYKPASYYYLGMLHLQGTSTIEKSEKKALKYFMKGLDKSKKELESAPGYFAHMAGEAYLNYNILIYIKTTVLYLKSSDNDDVKLGELMLKRLNVFYKGLIQNSDKLYFQEFANKQQLKK